jgi:hypothetical protein
LPHWSHANSRPRALTWSIELGHSWSNAKAMVVIAKSDVMTSALMKVTGKSLLSNYFLAEINVPTRYSGAATAIAVH